LCFTIPTDRAIEDDRRGAGRRERNQTHLGRPSDPELTYENLLQTYKILSN